MNSSVKQSPGSGFKPLSHPLITKIINGDKISIPADHQNKEGLQQMLKELIKLHQKTGLLDKVTVSPQGKLRTPVADKSYQELDLGKSYTVTDNGKILYNAEKEINFQELYLILSSLINSPTRQILPNAAQNLNPELREKIQQQALNLEQTLNGKGPNSHRVAKPFDPQESISGVPVIKQKQVVPKRRTRRSQQTKKTSTPPSLTYGSIAVGILLMMILLVNAFSGTKASSRKKPNPVKENDSITKTEITNSIKKINSLSKADRLQLLKKASELYKLFIYSQWGLNDKIKDFEFNPLNIGAKLTKVIVPANEEKYYFISTKDSGEGITQQYLTIFSSDDKGNFQAETIYPVSYEETNEDYVITKDGSTLFSIPQYSAAGINAPFFKALDNMLLNSSNPAGRLKAEKDQIIKISHGIKNLACSIKPKQYDSRNRLHNWLQNNVAKNLKKHGLKAKALALDLKRAYSNSPNQELITYFLLQSGAKNYVLKLRFKNNNNSNIAAGQLTLKKMDLYGNIDYRSDARGNLEKARGRLLDIRSLERLETDSKGRTEVFNFKDSSRGDSEALKHWHLEFLR